MIAVKYAWIGRGDIFALRFYEVDVETCEETPIPLASVTHADFTLGSHLVTVTSGDADAPVNWWEPSLSTGEAQFMLGPWTEADAIPAGKYAAGLVMYEVATPRGITFMSPQKGELQINLS